MLVAIGMQESRFKHRRQINGPARGYLQFEIAGVRGVLTHPASREHAQSILRTLDYPNDAEAVYSALEHNDVLAAVFGRLLLYTLPESLPSTASEGWRQYMAAWRPGKPHELTWAEHYRTGWRVVV